MSSKYLGGNNKKPVREIGNWAKTQIWDLPNVGLERHHCSNLFVAKAILDPSLMPDCCHLFTLVPRFRNFSTLKMETILYSETSVHTRSTRRHVPEDGILYSHLCENLRVYKFITDPM
jgi:hypothetical protein